MELRRQHAFVYENSNVYKLRLFFFSIVFALIAVAIAIAFRDFLFRATQNSTIIKSLLNLIKLKFTALSPADLFFASLIGGLFFILLPIEAIFFSSIKIGGNFFISTFMVVAGFTVAQAINYYIGYKFNPVVMNFISKKKVYKTRRAINKYGGYGVFFLNLSPLPAELLTFALGIARYNVYRLFFLQILGAALKYVIIVGIVALW